MKRVFLLFSALLFFCLIIHAQEKMEAQEGSKGLHQIGFMLSHSRIGVGVVNGVFQIIAVPSVTNITKILKMKFQFCDITALLINSKF